MSPTVTWSLFKSPVDDRSLFIYSSLIYRSLVVDSQVGSQIVTDVTVPAESGNFVPGSQFPQWKTPMKIAPRNLENFLFNRRDDPGQTKNLWATNVEQRERMLDVLRDILRPKAHRRSDRNGLVFQSNGRNPVKRLSELAPAMPNSCKRDSIPHSKSLSLPSVSMAPFWEHT